MFLFGRINKIFKFDGISLLGTEVQYIENRLIGTPLDESLFALFHLSSDDAIIFYPSIEWKKKICSQLEISFETSIEQHSRLNGQKLDNFTPLRCDDIVGNGNCLFGCKSKILSGSENNHVKLRGKICHYMVTEGRNILGWYCTQVHSTTPVQQLRTRSMTVDGKWG